VIRSLRARVILLVLVTSAVVAVVVVVAVQWFSSEQIAALLMEGVDTQAEADAMVDQYIGRVVALGALVGMVLGALSALWLVRRVLQPLEQFTRAIQMIASGDLSARVPDPPGAELHEVANAFNQMAATLERVEQLRAALVEDVAHELRTPLTSLRGYTEALADGIVEPDPDVLRTIHAEIERLTRLVQGLDELARWEASARERVRAEIDLGDVVRRALELATPELASRSISVRIDDGADLPRLRAEPAGIGQVVANLVQNAARYTTDGGEIVARLETDGGTVTCEIANTGDDIPQAELPLIWERLHRADRSRARATGGAGIGLAIVRQIVLAHGGEVGARSGGGRTEIWFRLPVGVPLPSA
jgi:two-component system, OmpR family, sensor histidine kinase BaeS